MKPTNSKLEQQSLHSAWGEFQLNRVPQDMSLRAWDAADEFMLAYLDAQQILAEPKKILILNDAFGALAVALCGHEVYSWSDSWLSQQALRTNLVANDIAVDRVKINSDSELCHEKVDCVLIKIPKALALLEHQLCQLRSLLKRHSTIIAAGMTRNIHRSTISLFERLIGPTSTTRARKKSRLILAQYNQKLPKSLNPYPDSYELQVDRSYRLVNHASLFSRDRLDWGSRLMIENLPVDSRFQRIVDLGCGNGVLGIVAASLNPAATLVFSDESYMAVASAELNFHNAFAGTRSAQFTVADGLRHLPARSQDLVLINPPFHQQYQVGDALAWQMFKDARHVLVSGGELLVVGNRHLGYHAKLKKLFGHCDTIAVDKKFVVLRGYY